MRRRASIVFVGLEAGKDSRLAAHMTFYLLGLPTISHEPRKKGEGLRAPIIGSQVWAEAVPSL